MHLFYDIAPNVTAFTAGKGCHGTEPGIDAREVGITFIGADGIDSPNPKFFCPFERSVTLRDAERGSDPNLGLEAATEASRELGPDPISRGSIFIPRQTHSVNVCWAEGAGECPDTDAVITRVPGLCVAVKTADCIPVLLYDEGQQLVAAVHAGWRGTVGRIVELTIKEMKSRGEDLYAAIGPGISLDAFEVGDEVYDAFLQAGFPMERIARRYPAIDNSQLNSLHFETSQKSLSEKWHLDLWEANRWLLEQCGVTRIHVDGTCTYTHHDQFYSARRETIKTGRNINGIMLL